MNKWKIISLLLLLVILAVGCGPRVNRSELNADAYFAYAKGLYDRGKYLDAITEFTAVTLKFVGDPIIDDAQYYLAESYYGNKEYLIAVAEYQKLVNDYPSSPYVEDANFKMGMSYYELSQRPALDQEYTDQAIRLFQNFIEEFPKSDFREKAEARMLDLRTKLAKKLLLGGNTYRKMGIYDSAIIYYDLLLEKYYDTEPAAKALFWKADCQARLKKYDEAITSYTVFLEKYPKSSMSSDAKKSIASLQEKATEQSNAGETTNSENN